jgi:single-stranded-DNA-specific exonuclease
MVTDLIEKLLQSRGITEETRDAFLSPDYGRDTHSPFLLQDMDRAVERILLAIREEETIAVYSDFDCDGIPGAVVMHDFFKKIGYEKFVVYLPNRDTEGYGLHIKAIDTLIEKGVSLIMTIDLGITALDQVAYAQSKGVDVIVTDHHELPTREAEPLGKKIFELPPAYAVIDPKRPGYPCKDLCGAAVAFKVVCALIQEGKVRKLPAFEAIVEGWEKWLLDMVGFATIADMVPLTGENRVYAKFGLKVLRKSRRAGMLALCKVARVQQPSIDEETIGYQFAPRVNAASRMDSPDIAYTLFSTDDISVAEECAKKLESLNKQRKGYTGALTKEVKERVKSWGALPSVIVVGSPLWKPALLGGVCSSLVEEYGRPVFLWGREGSGTLKGSCRSDGSVHLTELLAEAGDAVLQFGGHEMAGGYSIAEDKIHTLAERIAAAYERCKKAESRNMAIHDAVVTIGEATHTLFRELEQLAPFGAGNDRPQFLLPGVSVVSTRQFGSDGQHCEVVLSDGSKTMRAFSFFANPESFAHTPRVDANVQIVGTLVKNTFSRGMPIEFRIEDIHDGKKETSK